MKRIIIPLGSLVFFASAMTFGLLNTGHSVNQSAIHSISSNLDGRSGSILASLNFLTLNAFLRPEPFASKDRTHCRAKRLGRKLKNAAYDIIALNETFHEEDTTELADTLSQQYPHQRIRKPDHQLLGINGGLSILSRYPIIKTNIRRFQTCSGIFSDCLAAKGFVHILAEINQHLRINVITTHLDSGEHRRDKDARQTQLKAIKTFVSNNHSTQIWPTFLLGDLNINGIRSSQTPTTRSREYHRMLEILHRDETEALKDTTGPVDTFKVFRETLPSEVQYANTINCVGQKLRNCKSPKVNPDLKNRIDYIFHFGSPPQNKHLELQTTDAETHLLENQRCDTTYLSDHRGVEATIQIKGAERWNQISTLKNSTFDRPE